MSIRLGWRNVNAALADNIIIYRALAPIPADTLPAPLATLAPSATSYDDTTAVRGTVYYYRIAAVKGTDSVLSENQIHGYFPNNGPGPQKLARGDWKRGYFGRVAASDFLGVAETRTLCAFTTGTALAEASLTHWYKFIFDGKILYIPCLPISSNLSWQNIYNAGLVYGTDNFGVPPSGVTTVTFNVNQKKVVTAKGFDFIVRLPKASPQATTVLVTSAQYAESEWFETFCRSYLTTLRSEIKAKWDDQINTGLLYALTQHFSTTTAAVAFANGSAPDYETVVGPTAVGANNSWYPVFELQY